MAKPSPAATNGGKPITINAGRSTTPSGWFWPPAHGRGKRDDHPRVRLKGITKPAADQNMAFEN